MRRKRKILLKAIRASVLMALMALSLSLSCSNQDKTSLTSTGVSRYFVGMTAVYGGDVLPADGISQATIRVEVWDTNGQYIDSLAVNMSASRGTLTSSTLTTVNGVATTIFTAGTSPGAAYVNATVENASASVKIVLASF